MDKPEDIIDIVNKRVIATNKMMDNIFQSSPFISYVLSKRDPFIERIIAIRKEHGIPDPRPEKIFEGGRMIASNISWNGGEMANEDKD